MNNGLHRWALISGLVAVVVIVSVLVMQASSSVSSEPLAPTDSVTTTAPIVVETEIEAQRTPRPDIVTWSAERIDVIVSPGETVTKTVEITSRSDINDVTIGVSPNIMNVVNIVPDRFQPLRGRRAEVIHLEFTVPSNTAIGTGYNGTLEARRGFVTLPTILDVTVAVWPVALDDILGVSFSYPPTHSIDFVTEARTVVGRRGEGVEFKRDSDDFGSIELRANGRSFEAEVRNVESNIASGLTQEEVLVDGLSALRITGTLHNYVFAWGGSFHGYVVIPVQNESLVISYDADDNDVVSIVDNLISTLSVPN